MENTDDATTNVYQYSNQKRGNANSTLLENQDQFDYEENEQKLNKKYQSTMEVANPQPQNNIRSETPSSFNTFDEQSRTLYNIKKRRFVRRVVKSTRRGTKDCSKRGKCPSGCCEHHSGPDNSFNHRLYKILEKATIQQEQLEKQLELQKRNAAMPGQANPGAPGSYLPMVSSNHIQNLTINAQPGFNIGELTQVTQIGHKHDPQPISYQIDYGDRPSPPRDIFSIHANQTPIVTPTKGTKSEDRKTKQMQAQQIIMRKEDSSQSPPSLSLSRKENYEQQQRFIRAAIKNHLAKMQRNMDQHSSEKNSSSGFERLRESSMFNVPSESNEQQNQSKYTLLKKQVTKKLQETNSYLMPPKWRNQGQKQKNGTFNKFSYHRANTNESANNRTVEENPMLQIKRNISNSSYGSGATNNSKKQIGPYRRHNSKQKNHSRVSADRKNKFGARKAETLVLPEVQPTSKYFYDGNSETSPPASVPSQKQIRINRSIKTNMSSSQKRSKNKYRKEIDSIESNDRLVQILRDKINEIKENNGEELDKCQPEQQKEQFKKMMDQALEGFIDIIKGGGAMKKTLQINQNNQDVQKDQKNNDDETSLKSSVISNSNSSSAQNTRQGSFSCIKIMGVRKLDSSRSQEDNKKSGSGSNTSLSKKSKRSVRSAHIDRVKVTQMADNKLEFVQKIDQPDSSLSIENRRGDKKVPNIVSISNLVNDLEDIAGTLKDEQIKQSLNFGNRGMDLAVVDDLFIITENKTEVISKKEIDDLMSQNSSAVSLDTHSYHSKQQEAAKTDQNQESESDQKDQEDELAADPESSSGDVTIKSHTSLSVPPELNIFQHKILTVVQENSLAINQVNDETPVFDQTTDLRPKVKIQTDVQNHLSPPSTEKDKQRAFKFRNSGKRHMTIGPGVLQNMKVEQVICRKHTIDCRPSELQKFIEYIAGFEIENEEFDQQNITYFDDFMEIEEQFDNNGNTEFKEMIDLQLQIDKFENISEFNKDQTLQSIQDTYYDSSVIETCQQQFNQYFENLNSQYELNLQNKLQVEEQLLQTSKTFIMGKIRYQMQMRQRIEITRIYNIKEIIGVYDINIKNIIDTNLRAKFIRNQVYLEENLEYERLDRLYQKRQKSKIKRQSQLVSGKERFLSEFQIQNMEHELILTALRDPTQIYYRQNRYHKQQRKQDRAKDEQHYKNFMLYNDMVWKQKSNKLAFIKITRPDLIENNHDLQPQVMFEIRQRAIESGVPDQLDWDLIDAGRSKLKQFMAVGQQFGEFYEEINLSCATSLIFSNVLPFVKPHETILEKLDEKLNFGLKPTPTLLFFSIKSVVLEEQIDFINRRIFSKRYKKIVTQYDFRQKLRSIEDRQANAQRQYEAKNLASNFKEHLSYHVIHNSKNFNEILFMHQLNSLYYNLYDVEKDFELFLIIEKLFKKAKELCVSESNARTPTIAKVEAAACHHQHDGAVNGGTRALSRCHSHQSPTASLQQQLQSQRLSALVSDLEYYNQEDFGFPRQDALNKFNLQFCEFKIMQSLESRMNRVKDSVNMFYKQIETLIDQDDHDINELARKFGYKSVFMRDASNKYIMEVYVPCVITKGEEKLQLQAEKLEYPTSFKELKRQRRKLAATKKKQHKVFQAILVPEYETDESMTGIDYEDIISEGELSSGEEEDALSGRGHGSTSSAGPGRSRAIKRQATKRRLRQYDRDQYLSDHALKRQTHKVNYETFGQHTTALEHYNNLQRAREREHRRSNGKYLEAAENLDASEFLQNYVASDDKEPRAAGAKLFAVVSEDLLEEQGSKNFFTQMKKKYKVDHIIQQTQERVKQDNIHQAQRVSAELAKLGQSTKGPNPAYHRLKTSYIRNNLESSKLQLGPDSSEVKVSELQEAGTNNLGPAPKINSTQNESSKSHFGFKSDNTLMGTITDGNLLSPQAAPKLDLLALLAGLKTTTKEPDTSKLDALEHNLETEGRMGKEARLGPEETHDAGTKPTNTIKQNDMPQRGNLNSNSPQAAKGVTRGKSFVRLNSLSTVENGATILVSSLKLQAPTEQRRGTSAETGLQPQKDKTDNQIEGQKGTPRARKGPLERQGSPQRKRAEGDSSADGGERYIDTVSRGLAKQLTLQHVKTKLVQGVTDVMARTTAAANARAVANYPEDSQLDLDNELEILEAIRGRRQVQVKERERQNEKRERILKTLRETRQRGSKALGPATEKQTAQQLFAALNTTIAAQMGPRSGAGPPEGSIVKDSRMSINQSFKTIKVVAHLISNGGGVDRKQLKRQFSSQKFNTLPEDIGGNAPKGLKQGRTDLVTPDPNSINERSRGQAGTSPAHLTLNEEELAKSRSQHLADIRSQEQEEQSAKFIERMHSAITTRNRGLMEDVLKRYQGDLNQILDQQGNSLLILAALQGDYAMIDMLLAKGIDADHQNSQGNTALHFACMKRLHKCVDTLIAFGVAEDLENDGGKTAWQMA